MMRSTIFRLSIIFTLLITIWFSIHIPVGVADEIGQQPTVSIPTVTGTPEGPKATVNTDQDQINVRSGPGTDYEKVGVLVASQSVTALGRSAAGLWIQIVYPGVDSGVAWVYAPLVSLSSSDLPIVEPPPTPTPRVTPTIDPTLAARFIVEVPPTRLPTFTPPPPLAIPTYPVRTSFAETTGVPVILWILLLSVVGLFGGVISLLRGR